jgi:glycosyltransferase involved in cell wall biosynthesis
MEKKMKVAFYIGSLYAGGSERHVVRLLEGLPKAGYQVALMVNSKTGDLLEKVVHLGVKVVEMPISPTLVGRLGFIFHAARFLRQHRFDIVQGYNDISILYISLAARLAGTRRVVFALRNTHQLKDASLKTKIIGWVCRHLVRGVIVNSNQTALQLTTQFNVPVEDIKIAFNGIETLKDRQTTDAVQMRQKLSLHADRKTIGLAARLDPVKKVEILIKAAALLSDIPIQYVIVGDGQERAKLETLAATANQAGNFIFAGQQKNALSWISAFDIGVLCSESEGFPQAILEYMATGLPVVAPAVGGIPELVVEGETGFLVSPGDPFAFAAALRRLIEDPELSSRMGNAGQQRARECFSRESEISAHAAAYQSWLERAS